MGFVTQHEREGGGFCGAMYDERSCGGIQQW